MNRRSILQILAVITLTTLTLTSCNNAIRSIVSTPTPFVEESALPTPRATLPELIDDLTSHDMNIRLASIYALERYGNEAKSATPALIANLSADDFDVRRAAAYILGKLGEEATDAVPQLIEVLLNDENLAVRETVAEALGQIGDKTSIPALAQVLFEKINQYQYGVSISCAKAIARITGQNFTDINSNSYILNGDHIPLIVIDAREWWLNEGQFEDWSKK